MCPSQKIEIPSVVRNLGTHYQDIDRSLTGIRKVSDELETDEQMSQLTHLSISISRDFAEITETLDFLQLNYNTSLSFLQSFDKSLTTIQHLYNDYNLYILWHGVLFILGTLFAIKLVTLLIQCV